MKYPIFKNPEQYLATRQPPGIQTSIKIGFERRAIHKLLRRTASLKQGIVDVPCGPGRLFPILKDLKVPVYGVDLSADFVEHAKGLHRQLGLEGWVASGDAFDASSLRALFPEKPPSLVASVRFIYYFAPERRLAFLQGLRSLGARYLLTQYMVDGGPRSWLKRLRGKPDHASRAIHLRKCMVKKKDIRKELESAGLRLIQCIPSGPFSTRLFVLAEFTDNAAGG